MQWQGYVCAIQSALCVYLMLVAGVLAMHRSDTEAPEQPYQIGDVCRGFVVLANGIAVLSGMSETPASAGTRVPHIDHPAGVMTPNTDRSHMASTSPASSAPLPLMGSTHSQEIVL